MLNPIDQLLDIRGLDSGSWWPPAIGWWLLALMALFGLIFLYHFAQWLRRRPPRWQRDALRQLHGLRRLCRKQSPKETASALSELLRRIAMARFGRAACAGLYGAPWLEWIEARDPTGFRWSTQGQLLLDLPYAPPGGNGEHNDQLYQLISAALIWVVASKEPKGV